MAIGLRFGQRRVPEVSFLIDLLNGAAATAHENGFGLLISAPEINEQVCDGLIVVDPFDQAELEVPGLKVITVGRAANQDGVPSVYVDHSAMVTLLMDHAAEPLPPGPVWLLSQVTGATDTFHVKVHRSLELWCDRWCSSSGRECSVVEFDDQSQTVTGALREAIERIGTTPAVIFCETTGHHAVEAQRFLQSRGARVPQDFVVVAVAADSATIASDPPILAVQPTGWDYGRQAVEALLGWMESDVKPDDVVIQPRLV